MPEENMCAGWVRKPLEQCVESIIDYRGKTPIKTSFGVPLITAKVIKNGRIDWDNVVEFISEDDYESWMKRGIPVAGAVVITTEAPLGEVAQLGTDKIALAQRVITLCGKVGMLNNTFLRYLLQTNYVQGQLLARGSGTTVTGIKQSELRKVLLPFPPIPEQRAIAAILSALDDKIELNRQMNRTLEEMAQAIFKEWFVDFGPFRDGGMQDSELGPIPVGWRVEPLDQTANFLNGLALQKYPAVEGQPYLPVIKIREMRQGISEATDKASTKVPNAYVINDGDLLFSWSGSLEIIYWTGGPGALNQHLFKVTSTEFPSWFCYHWILEHLPFFRTIAASKATTMGHIQRKHLSEVKAIVPESDSLKMMHSIMQPICDQRILLDLENKTLSIIRDTLLPKLMSGELRVPVSDNAG